MRDFIDLKLFDEYEMLPPLMENNVKRNVDSFDEDIDSIDEAFDKLEEKVSRLSRRWGDKVTNNEDTSNEESKVFSKKPKLFEKLDSNNKTDHPGSDEESDSHSTEEEFAKKLDRDADSNITY